ncbi:MAG: hypothetical protein ABR591_13130 [Candidatus Velthaea sp.]
MNYAVAGMALSMLGAALGLLAMGHRPSSYAQSVYHMTARSHRRFALVSLFAVGAFGVALRWNALAVPLLAVYILAAVLYGASFARGFSGEDE